MDHLQACPHCPKFIQFGISVGCSMYKDVSWVNRRGGCPGYPFRSVPKLRGEYVDGVIMKTGRVGQQHQKRHDRKYDNRKVSRKFGRKA